MPADSDRPGVESVLLYYKYVDLRGELQAELQAWLLALCERLALVGRVRVAQDGVNCTVGGSHAALLEHVAAAEAHPLLGSGIDFKLARSAGPLNAAAVRETGFDSLQVSLCKEVVSLQGAQQFSPQELPSQTATHLAPEQWHSLLLQASSSDGSSSGGSSSGSSSSSSGGNTVLLDARNLYETRIGHFSAAGAQLLDPKLRQFSQLPAWLDANAGQLRGKRILMYCTGGVRCERASALVKALGPGFSDVFQLQGGIQRYLEAFPDGGLFRGKNFVFDERVAVGPAAAGEACQPVGRCLACEAPCDCYGARARCSSCRMLVLLCADCAKQQAAQPLRCELCAAAKAALPRPLQGARLRLLCLHGFRQSGALLQRQLSRLQRDLADLAQLSFADAPHALPFLYRPPSDPEAAKPLPAIDASRPRRAWLLEPAQLQAGAREQQEARWEAAEGPPDPQQHLKQTHGWAESAAALRAFLAAHGPFDGCLGLSQGAAAAAAYCAECQAAAAAEPPDSAQHERSASLPFRFAVLCAGYASPAPEHRRLLQQQGCLALPSLHILGAEDGQVAAADSLALAERFQPQGRVLLRHRGRGHGMPQDRRSLALLRSFLEGVQQQR